MSVHPSQSLKCNQQSAAEQIALFTPKQVYAIEKEWFDNGNHSYSLMQQAAWQCAYWIHNNISATPSTMAKQSDALGMATAKDGSALTVAVWVGSGNNGGDGWLVAHYLSQLGAQVTVVEVGQSATTDANSAKQQALETGITVSPFTEKQYQPSIIEADVYIDALFGIGLDRVPRKDYAEAITKINQHKRQRGNRLTVISIDVPSGLVAGTGQVFEQCAVLADITLCLVARKLGLHIKDGIDYRGQVVDIALIPNVLTKSPVAWLQSQASALEPRKNNTHKGSFGSALIIGGNQVDGSQGMGGAAILSTSTAFATGVGKLTVACHKAFHSSVISSVPNAMSLDLHSTEAVKELIKQSDAIAIGMGMGRDPLSFDLFKQYLQFGLEQEKDLVIDADGLYHLAALAEETPKLIEQLQAHATRNEVWYTPHSGEAARLLGSSAEEVEADRLQAVSMLRQKYQGSWLLKGVGSIVQTQQQTYVCAAGNPGMATAGMGDVLSGLALGLLAQTGLSKEVRSLQQAVMLHALAGDELQKIKGIWALQASDMPTMVGKMMQQLTLK